MMHVFVVSFIALGCNLQLSGSQTPISDSQKLDELFIISGFEPNELSKGPEIDERLNESQENETNATELFPMAAADALPGRRQPRKFFGKLHSKASFLTGLKLGTLLSKNGFELGHGKIASTHSFQIFGKTVNKAMSLSYGDTPLLLPLDVTSNDETPVNSSPEYKTVGKDVFRVTVIEHSPDVLVEKLGDVVDEVKPDEGIGEAKAKEKPAKVLPSGGANEETSFLDEHNKLVKNFNENILRSKRKF